jgi:hypothetical protein
MDFAFREIQVEFKSVADFSLSGCNLWVKTFSQSLYHKNIQTNALEFFSLEEDIKHMVATSDCLLMVDQFNYIYVVDTKIKKIRKIDKMITGLYYEAGILLTTEHEIHSYDL